ncbi:MAG TPA: helical backbone metal receptor [Gemmatimonadales bacterium]|nr:helical backbone metal receptor [Gemmatimonadales bacterium]
MGLDPKLHDRIPRARRAVASVILAAASFVAPLGLLQGCHAAPVGQAGTTIADDAGDSVKLTLPVHRIVSLNPAATELLFAIGAGNVVVGRTTWCDYPPEAQAVPSLGDGINPNLEAIVARKPDLVLLYSSSQNADAVQRLAQLGIPALRLRSDSLSDVPRLARLFGRLTGRTEAADSVSRTFETELAKATVHPEGARPTVFLLVWDQPPMTVGRGSFLTELLERAGAENLFADVATSSAPVSIEAVAARNPNVILALGVETPAFLSRPEWQVVPAVRQRRLVREEGSEFSRPSPRAPAAIREFREAVAEAME